MDPEISPTAPAAPPFAPSPLAVLAAAPGDDDAVLISDAATGRDQIVAREALLDLLASSRSGTQAPAGLPGGSAHWWQRGWHPCLDLTLWSRRAPGDAPPVTNEPRTPLVGESQETAALPDPLPLPAQLSCGEALLRRRTVRRFAPGPVSAALFSAVLWWGLDGVRDGALRAAWRGSLAAGIGVYVVVYDVADTPAGVYRYQADGHALRRGRAGLLRDEMTRILFGQQAPQTASWTIVLVMDFERLQTLRPDDSGLRRVFLEAGRIGQRTSVAATAFGLGGFMTPALRDRELVALLALDGGTQAPLYSLTLGRAPRPGGV